jgi:MFS family permease
MVIRGTRRFRKFESIGGRNALILAICHGIFTCAISIDLTLTGLTGWQLAPTPPLATLPFALITVAGAVSTLFASHLLQRIGQQMGFALGSLIGALGGLLSVWAVFRADFWLFCIGTSAVGIYQAFSQYYRLAAADSVETSHKSRAISIVLAGGVIAAIVGPMLAAWSKDFFDTALFAGAYLMVAAMGGASAVLLLIFYRNTPTAQPLIVDLEVLATRPTGLILRQPIFVASVANNIVGSITMMFVMTAAPLAAVACGYSIDDGASIIQWHLVGMYAPSFMTALLITRYGLSPVLYTGMALNLACVAIAATSINLTAFHIALFLLGVGWNFMFVGGTTLLAHSYRPLEQARTQGIAEFIRYATTAVATLIAGPFLHVFGWAALNIAIIPLIALAAILTVWWGILERRSNLAAVQNFGNKTD